MLRFCTVFPTAVKIPLVAFWFRTSFDLVDGQWIFGGIYCFQLDDFESADVGGRNCDVVLTFLIKTDKNWKDFMLRANCQLLRMTGVTQERIKLFGAPRQWKLFRPLFQAVFLSGEGVSPPPDWVKHHASQSQDRNNKYFIIYIEFCINNKI